MKDFCSYYRRFNPECFDQPRDLFYNFIPFWEKPHWAEGMLRKMKEFNNCAQVERLLTKYYPTKETIRN